MKNNIKILLYHGIRKIKNIGIQNYSNKHLHIKDFIKQMKFIKKNLNIISMDQVEYLIKNKIDKPYVAVTFDDGFKNNYDLAADVLDFYNIPATFYVSTAYIGKKKMFWVDILEDIFNNKIKDKLEIKLSKNYIFDTSTKYKRINTLNYVKNYCKNAIFYEKERVLNFLIKKFNFKNKISINNSYNYKSMNWKDVLDIGNNKNFIIGGHSHNHEILSKLPKDLMKKEIKTCIDLLSKKLKKKINHFSYPEGLGNHFNENIINFLKKSGITTCPTAINGVNFSNQDLFRLKRIMVGMNKISFPFNI
jgi:peptidoglycan/xylan/chitin deacetylase (PgdA/CDA1 family)